MSLNVAGSIGIFGVLNADGSVNSAANPAKGGSIVSLYLTGLGLPSNSPTDGAVSLAANSAFTGAVEVTFGGSLAAPRRHQLAADSGRPRGFRHYPGCHIKPVRRLRPVASLVDNEN
jgi:uncharacterized protein (TIGR03437 family)